MDPGILKVFQSGPEGWGTVLVNVVFGAWFGRVLLETGIASTLIRRLRSWAAISRLLPAFSYVS